MIALLGRTLTWRVVLTHAIAKACYLMSLGANADWLLASRQTRVMAGERIDIQVVDTDSRAGSSQPVTLPAQLALGERTIPLLLQAVEMNPAASGPERAYTVTLPGNIEGLATLSLTTQTSTRLLLDIGRPAQPASGDTLARMRGEAEPPSGVADHEPALTSHEPVYLLLGSRETTNARFQISFKYRLFDQDGLVAGWVPFLAGLHFAYTQNSIWDLGQASKPFRDTSYRPSLFYQWRTANAADLSKLKSVQAGFEHESNGKDGAASRSINTLFVRPEWRIILASNRHFAIVPKLLVYLDKTDNPDIQRYRGYADLHLRFGNDREWLLTSNLRRGTANFGTAQFDLSYPLKRSLFADTGGYLHFQYVNGYGESLLDYNVRRKSQFRVGFSIVR
jgi:outer membrane phospholipase A